MTITRDFEQATVNWPNNDNLCSNTIKKSWAAIEKIAKQGLPVCLYARA